MASSIEPCSFFSYSLNPTNNKPPQSTNTNKKASAVADQHLSNTTWYVNKVPNKGKPPVTKRLPPNMVDVVSKALISQAKPTPPPRSDTTCLTPKPERTDNQEKVFGPDLKDALTFAKKTPPIPLPRSNATCLSSTLERSHTEAPVENTPPLPSPQKHKPKFESASTTVPTSSLKRRVSFQTEAANQETNSPQILKTLPFKGILKKALSFRNAEENKPHNEADPSTKIHNPPELNENPDAKKELDLAMDELNAILETLGIDPVSNFSK